MKKTDEKRLDEIKKKIEEITGYDISEDHKYRLIFFYIARKRYYCSYISIDSFVHPFSMRSDYQDLLVYYMSQSKGLKKNFEKTINHFGITLFVNEFIEEKMDKIQEKKEKKARNIAPKVTEYDLTLLKVKNLGYTNIAAFILENGVDKFKALKNGE